MENRSTKQASPSRRARDAYRWLAPVYEGVEGLYSGGAIRACKRALMDQMVPGERILFIGAGTAGEALYAARRGMAVTLCDTSPAMLARARSRFLAAGLAVPDIRACSWEDLPAEQKWPNIVANFFLNIFPAAQLQPVVDGVAALLAPGGQLLIADFGPCLGTGLSAWLQKAYWYLPSVIANSITGDPLHGVPVDYRELLTRAGFDILYQREFAIFKWGPRWFRALVARKPAPLNPS